MAKGREKSKGVTEQDGGFREKGRGKRREREALEGVERDRQADKNPLGDQP